MRRFDRSQLSPSVWDLSLLDLESLTAGQRCSCGVGDVDRSATFSDLPGVCGAVVTAETVHSLWDYDGDISDMCVFLMRRLCQGDRFWSLPQWEHFLAVICTDFARQFSVHLKWIALRSDVYTDSLEQYGCPLSTMQAKVMLWSMYWFVWRDVPDCDCRRSHDLRMSSCRAVLLDAIFGVEEEMEVQDLRKYDVSLIPWSSFNRAQWVAIHVWFCMHTLMIVSSIMRCDEVLGVLDELFVCLSRRILEVMRTASM